MMKSVAVEVGDEKASLLVRYKSYFVNVKNIS
ncbi:hypothetical protein FHS90_001954 [Rufibacter quisquiliarum]|uniref:Uncharacterized protein n=1 Tax=Rufibacter quisquiliarum TaxID=1549639 RepID=A0A839GHV9_9BACT|nr:hypothetical protein [Rufibacter quisquiliarum]